MKLIERDKPFRHSTFLVFESTGREQAFSGYPSDDCPIGIGPNADMVYEGSDGSWWSETSEGATTKSDLTTDERRELADYMIERWQRFADG